MADAAQRVLLNEFKALSKEAWTHIEVCSSRCPSEWRSLAWTMMD